MDFECVQDERESEIWRFFLLNKTEKLAKCNICPLTLKITGGRTSNMWQHVKIHHSAAYQSLSEPARVKKVARRNGQMVSKLVSKIKKKNLNYGRRQVIRSTTTVKSESSTSKPGFISNPKSANIDKDNKLDGLAGFETVKRSSNVWQYFLFHKKEKSVKCKLCSQQYLDKNGTSQLHNHLKSKHLTEFQSLVRNEPEKKFLKTLTKLPARIDSFVKNVSQASKPIKKEGETISKLQSTQNASTIDQLKKLDVKNSSYKCEFCSVDFDMKYQLYEHMALSHKDTKPYKCEKCNAKYTQQKLLDQHFNFMHKPTIELKCEKCNTNFTSNANLNMHIATVHDEKKPFKCGMCNSKFSSKFHLNRHLVLIHQAKKTFKCKICHLVYGEVSDLKKHLSSAHKINKPIKNQHCEPSNKSNSKKLNHETESSVTLDHNSEVSSQTSSGQLNEYFGMVHEENKPVKKECFESIDEFQSTNSLDHLGQFAMIHEANNPIKSECLQSSDNPKIDDNKEQDCQMAADLVAVSIKKAREKLENEDFVPIKKGAKIWEFFLFNKKDKIAKCIICSNTKSVLKGTQGLNSHIKTRHPDIFESFKENLMPLENTKTPSSKYILAQSSEKLFKKTIQKSKCEPSADNKKEEQLKEHLAIGNEGNKDIKKEPFEMEDRSESKFKLNHNSEEHLMPLENTKTPFSKYIFEQSFKKSVKKKIEKSKCETSADNEKEENCNENPIYLFSKDELDESLNNIPETFQNEHNSQRSLGHFKKHTAADPNITFENVKGQGKRKSKVWQFFLLNKEAGMAKCTLCSRIYKITLGSTKGLLGHLKSKHFKECMEKLGTDPFNQSMDKHSTSLVSFPENDSKCNKSLTPVKSSSQSFERHSKSLLSFPEYASNCNKTPTPVKPRYTFFIKDSDINTNPKNVIDNDKLLCLQVFEKYSKKFEEFREHWVEIVDISPIEIIKELAKIVDEFFKIWRQYEQWSPLQIAVMCGNLKLCKYMVWTGKDKNPRQKDGMTALHFAVQNNNLEVCKIIIDHAEEKNPGCAIGNTPLHWAAILGYLDICKYIMEKLDDEHPKNANGKSPIHFAAQYGHLEVYKLLVENIEDKNHGDNDGITPLHMAAKYGHLEVYRFIIMNRHDRIEDKNPRNNEGLTPLHEAVSSGHYELSKFIVENVLDKNPASNDGKTPMHIAARFGHLQLFTILFENEPLLLKNPGDNEEWTPFHDAAEHGHLEICNLIIKNIFDKNSLASNGRTPFHVAAQHGHLEICKLILEDLEGDKNPGDCAGTTPFHDAAEEGYFEICTLILCNDSVEENPENNVGKTPLHLAAKNGHIEVCELISKEIIDKNPEDINGQTPLHDAAENGYFDICKLILDNVEDQNPADIWGNTPLHRAARQGHFEICRIITQDILEKDPMNKFGETPFQCIEEDRMEEYANMIESTETKTEPKLETEHSTF